MGGTDNSVEFHCPKAGTYSIRRAGYHVIRDLEGNKIATGDGEISFTVTRPMTVVSARQ